MRECKHPSCGETCGKPKKEKKIYRLKRTPLKRKFYKIKKVSEKRKEENKIYSFRRRLFLAARPRCEIQSPVCTYKATVIHHKKGREGDLFLDERFWAASCEQCNLYVEVHDKWARENCYKLSKHTKEENTNNN